MAMARKVLQPLLSLRAFFLLLLLFVSVVFLLLCCLLRHDNIIRITARRRLPHTDTHTQSHTRTPNTCNSNIDSLVAHTFWIYFHKFHRFYTLIQRTFLFYFFFSFVFFLCNWLFFLFSLSFFFGIFFYRIFLQNALLMHTKRQIKVFLFSSFAALLLLPSMCIRMQYTHAQRITGIWMRRE